MSLSRFGVCALFTTLLLALWSVAAPAAMAQEEPAADEATSEAVPEEAPAPAPEPEPAPEPAPVVEPAPEPAPVPAVEATAAAPAAAAEGIEEIVVTGTRIGRDNLEEFGHITVLTADDIKSAGITTVDQLLFELPTVTLNGISRNDNNGGIGLAWVELRNLGVDRTLVLVNGRRFVSSSTGVSEGVDLNNIPVPMIERVEVLLDGASAAYGADAVAGVINIITKTDFEGVLLDAQAGITDKADGEQTSVSGTIGANYDKGNITFNANWMRRGEVKAKDRNWSKTPVTFAYFDDADGDGKITTPKYDDPSELALAEETELVMLCGSSIPPEGRDVWSGGWFSPDPDTGASFSRFGGNGCPPRYNFNTPSWATGRVDRLSLNLQADYEFAENAELYVEGLYANRHSRQQMAPVPITAFNTPYPNGWLVPLTNPYIPDDYMANLEPGTEWLMMYRRSVETGPRIYDQEADTFRLVTGVRGDMFNKFKWDVFFNYGRSQADNETRNQINLTKAIEAGDPALCAQKEGTGCVVANYFGAGAMSEEAADYIKFREVDRSMFDQYQVAGSVTGDVYQLPYGGLGLALGAEFRREQGYYRPSPLTVGQDNSGNLSGETQGYYQVGEAFGEISIPIVRGVTGVHDLTLDGAARFSQFNTFGSAFTYRGALSWAPVPDVRVRGTYSTAFRAPGISDLYGGSADSYEIVDDPCSNYAASGDPVLIANCQADNVPATFAQRDQQLRTNIGGNPELDAEKAQVLSGGLVFTPTFLPAVLKGFSATADFYQIKIDNAISSVTPQIIVDECYRKEGRSELCDRIARGPTGDITFLDASSENVGKVDTTGLDVAVRYNFPLARVGLDALGRLDLGWQGSFLFTSNETLKAGGSEPEDGECPVGTAELDDGLCYPFNKYAGFIDSSGGFFPKLRWTIMAGLTGESWAVQSTHRYIASAWDFGHNFTEADAKKVYGDDWEELDAGGGSDPFPQVSAMFYWDISAQYTYQDLTLVVGVDNVMDVAPPFYYVGLGPNTSNAAGYDYLGRYIYTTLSYRF